MAEVDLAAGEVRRGVLGVERQRAVEMADGRVLVAQGDGAQRPRAPARAGAESG